MRTRRRKRDDITDSDSDAENQSVVTKAEHRPKKSRRTLSTTAEAGSSAGDLAQLKDIMVEESKKRDENQKEMVETLRESTRVYERTSEKYLAAILQLSNQQ